MNKLDKYISVSSLIKVLEESIVEIKENDEAKSYHYGWNNLAKSLIIGFKKIRDLKCTQETKN